MNKIFTVLMGILTFGNAHTQTTVYTTGQTYADNWSNWSTPVTTNVNASSVNGANIYAFTLSANASYTIETTREFNIASDDIDIYLNATTQNATLSIEYSEDNLSWNSIGSLTYGPGFAYQTLTIPTFNPVPTIFYLKLKMTGTAGSPAQAQLNNLKIDADLSAETVSIAPSSIQNILTNVNGTLLTATELPANASSREWKYSTSSGSGYTSFATSQTTTSYTPNFSTIGTYYVICESNFSGTTTVSNEVRINVTAPLGVDELNTPLSLVYFNNILHIQTVDENYQISIYNISGQLILKENNITTYDFSRLEQGIYIVNMTSELDQKSTLKISNF